MIGEESSSIRQNHILTARLKTRLISSTGQIHIMRDYRILIFLLIIVSLLFGHLYISISSGKSPLSWEAFVLVFSPFLIVIWNDLKSIMMRNDVQRIKLGKDGFEFEKATVTASISKAMHGNYLNKKELQSIFDSVAANEWATLVLARMLMRKGLSAIALKKHHLGDSPSLRDLISLVQSNNRLTETEAADLERLRDVTYFAEWLSGNPPVYTDWYWALENSQRIIENIMNKQSVR